MKRTRAKRSESIEDLLRDLMIVQLGLAGVSQHEIRKIVGVDIHRVNRVLKHLKKNKGSRNG